ATPAPEAPSAVGTPEVTAQQPRTGTGQTARPATPAPEAPSVPPTLREAPTPEPLKGPTIQTQEIDNFSRQYGDPLTDIERNRVQRANTSQVNRAQSANSTRPLPQGWRGRSLNVPLPEPGSMYTPNATSAAAHTMTDAEYTRFLMSNGQSPLHRAASSTLQAAGRGARAAGRVAKGSAPFIMAMAAVDPEGTAEFMDDVAHFRVGKIATDMYEGGKQLVLHPIDTASAIGTAIADKTANYYEGTTGFWDGTGRTAMIPVHGLVNIGNVEWAAVGSVGDATHGCINWVLDACGSNTELVREGTSMRDFQRDPLEFFGNVFAPARRDRTTGLRSDDDFNTLIFRGDTNAFDAYLNTGVNVNTRIAGEHDRGIHHYQTAFALAIAEDQFDIAKMLFDRQETNINAINESTGDTPLINAIRYTALNEYESEYYTGKPDMSNATEAAKAKYIKANALILGMINDNRIDLNATNEFGQSAFLFAAECGNLAAVKALAAKNANIHHTNIWGQNALHVACCNQLMTAELLNLGIDANAKDRDGNTPLMTALEKNEANGGRNDIAVCLLISYMNKDGLTALRSSEKHSQLLNEWFECYPDVKTVIAEMKDEHPLNQDATFTGESTLQTTLANAQERQDSDVVQTRENERN
ncbi:MAG: ankyrin repeat domain-containing protein, partial [Alphaproteobacteria bacterium]|nr:ankyrin repeat domain-containing protein [Alphaproteobacteria bacterium]